MTHVEADATQAFVDAGVGQTKPPDVGEQFFLTVMTVTNRGASAAQLDSWSRFRGRGPSGATFVGNDCGHFWPDPNALANQLLTVAPGATASGNALCWRVKTTDASGMLMVTRSSPSARPVWFALTPSAPLATPAPMPTPGIGRVPVKGGQFEKTTSGASPWYQFDAEFMTVVQIDESELLSKGEITVALASAGQTIRKDLCYPGSITFNGVTHRIGDVCTFTGLTIYVVFDKDSQRVISNNGVGQGAEDLLRHLTVGVRIPRIEMGFNIAPWNTAPHVAMNERAWRLLNASVGKRWDRRNSSLRFYSTGASWP